MPDVWSLHFSMRLLKRNTLLLPRPYAVAYLLGHRDVHESLTDARVLHFLRAYFQEVVNTVPPVPGVDLDQYQNRLIQRFSNVHIRDKLQRLAEDGSMKLYNTMRGPLIDLLEKSQSIDMIALSIAGYACVCVSNTSSASEKPTNSTHFSTKVSLARISLGTQHLKECNLRVRIPGRTTLLPERLVSLYRSWLVGND